MWVVLALTVDSLLNHTNAYTFCPVVTRHLYFADSILLQKSHPVATAAWLESTLTPPVLQVFAGDVVHDFASLRSWLPD